jgi:hypothetical protein
MPDSSDLSENATPEAEPDPRTRDTFFDEIRAAAMLLEFAVAQGLPLERTLIPRIKRSQDFLSIGAPWPSDEYRSDFESAYRDLAQTMKPVTAATLAATQDGPERWRASRARLFSKRLYALVILCAAFIVLDQYLASTTRKGIDEWKSISHIFLPFVYGLVGALTYLLRSAHTYIADRTFDLYRRPEYYNRMVLGFIGGGIVLVFVGDPKSLTVGQNAISFLVGYNTDYLFQMIERVAQAVFPKDASAVPPGLAGISLEKDTLAPDDSGKGTVNLTGKAPRGGMMVSLAADPGITLTLTNIKIAEGATSADFTFRIDSGPSTGAKLGIAAKHEGGSVMAIVKVS